MSNDKGSAAPVNVVKPTSNRSSASQGLEDDNPTMSTNSSFLPPDTPPVLLAALSKEIEPIHLFTQPFGTVNKYGETLLFDLPIQVCAAHINMYKSLTVCRVSAGKVAIVFYPEQGKVLVIVKENDSFWPVTKEVLKNTSPACEEQGFNTYVCSVEPVVGTEVSNTGRKTHDTWCYLVNINDYLYVKFCNEKDHNRFKNAIRNAQSRISKNQLPKNDIPKIGGARAVSEFWHQTTLHPCDLKLLLLHEAVIWKIDSVYSPSEHGFIAIAQYKANKSLQLITFAKSDNINQIKNNYEVSEDFTLIASDISSDTNNFVWEWYVDCNERNACGFKTAKEASNFKIVTDYYLDAWKKKSLSWDW